jgi:hypothetical protein
MHQTEMQTSRTGTSLIRFTIASFERLRLLHGKVFDPFHDNRGSNGWFRQVMKIWALRCMLLLSGTSKVAAYLLIPPSRNPHGNHGNLADDRSLSRIADWLDVPSRFWTGNQ